jgi:hypothetical protein
MHLSWISPDSSWAGESNAAIMLCSECEFDYTHLEHVTEFERLGGKDKQTVAHARGRTEIVNHNPSP